MYGRIGASSSTSTTAAPAAWPFRSVSGHRDRVDALDDDIQPESEFLSGDLMGDGATDRYPVASFTRMVSRAGFE
jgi:hypothetical protein